MKNEVKKLKMVLNLNNKRIYYLIFIRFIRYTNLLLVSKQHTAHNYAKVFFLKAYIGIHQFDII